MDRKRKLFHRDAGERPASEERDRENEADGPQERPPRPVDGVGDEAFWTGSPQVGALYVLKGDVFLRVSVGGGEPKEVRIDRKRSLARRALRRLLRAGR